MLNAFLVRLKSLPALHRPSFAHSWNDEVARITKWHPLVGLKNSTPRKLIRINDYRIELHATTVALLASVVVTFFGILISMAGLKIVIQAEAGELFTLSTSVTLLLGAGITVVGIVLKKFVATPIIIDKALGYFWSGKAEPTALCKVGRRFAPIADIYALQLLMHKKKQMAAQFGPSQNPVYIATTYFELNFVLCNGKRINLLQSSDVHHIGLVAHEVSQLLDLPLWHGQGVEELSKAA